MSDYLEVKDLVEIFLKRLKKDKDVACAISGYEGDGKSVLACQMVLENLKQIGRDEQSIKDNFNEYMIYSPNREEMFKKITRKEKYTTINSDEAVKSLYKLNWASNSQKFLNMLFQLCRKENKINLLCIPRFTDLNEYFRNHRVMFWIHILETGTAVLMIRDWSPFSKDPWHLDENRKIIDMSRKRRKIGDFNISEKVGLMKKARGFVALLRWDDLESSYKKIYLAGKEKFGYEDMNDIHTELQGTTSLVKLGDLKRKVAHFLKDSGKNTDEICEFLDAKKPTVYQYLRQPVELKGEVED
jgi:hypothetical protein